MRTQCSPGIRLSLPQPKYSLLFGVPDTTDPFFLDPAVCLIAELVKLLKKKYFSFHEKKVKRAFLQLYKKSSNFKFSFNIWIRIGVLNADPDQIQQLKLMRIRLKEDSNPKLWFFCLFWRLNPSLDVSFLKKDNYLFLKLSILGC